MLPAVTMRTIQLWSVQNLKHLNGALLMGQVAVIGLSEASVQAAIGQVKGAQARGAQILNEEVVDQAVIIPLIVPVITV